MFIGDIIPFQTEHEQNLLRKCADYQEVVLYAPTGSGKTVLVSRFIDDYLDENPNTVFLWLCPGAGGLERQSQETFEAVTSGILDGDVYSFINEPDPRGRVYFINWDKINKKSNVVLREGEHKDLMTKVLHCHNDNIDIFMIIDEEHKYRDTANEYVANIQPVHVLRISATPVTRVEAVEEIKDDEVIGAGLIATGISINEGLSKAIEENNQLDDDLQLLELADSKRKEIQAEYNKRGLRIRPLVLIQFPNASEEWIERVKQHLADMGYSENSGLVASWFSGDHPDNPEQISRLDGHYAFLLFKQAIATGWDCPRAKILVKLREGGTERFNIQTVGRIRRMPERHHYDNTLLDNCYLFTLDNEFTEGMTASLNDAFYVYQYKRILHAPNIQLEKEYLLGSDRFAVDPQAVVTVVRSAMLKECDLNKDGVLEKREMEVVKGYIFGTKLKTSAFEGVARTTHDMMKLNSIFGGEHQINNHDDGFIIRDAKRRIAVKASELIRSSGTVMADSSTTVVEAMKLQMDEESLIVVTNSIDLCMELTDAKMHIISTGGNFNKHSMSFQGAITKKTLMQYNVRLAVISCKGLDASKGVLDSYESEAEIKKLMIMQSEKTALLVDHNKFDRKAFLKVADLSEIDYIVTDEKPSDEWISLCEEKGIQLIY